MTTIKGVDFSAPILLFSHDKRLAQTRHWVLEQSGLRVSTVYTLPDLDTAAAQQQISVFLLCNSLSAELRTETILHIRTRWPNARLLVFVPSYPLPELPVDEFFASMEGPRHLVEKVQRLLPAAVQP